MAKPNQSWLLSFADTITLLICLFLMILAMSEVKTDSMIRWSSERLHATQAQIQQILSAKMGLDLPETVVTPNGIHIFINQSDGFEKGSVTPSEKLIKTIQYVALSLQMTHLFEPEVDATQAVFIESMRKKGYEWRVNIRIEGHTDNIPIQINDARFNHFNNWGLSALRAKEILQILHEETNFPKHVFSIAGYGSQHPRASNETAEGRAKNRRITILIEAGFKKTLPVSQSQSL